MTPRVENRGSAVASPAAGSRAVPSLAGHLVERSIASARQVAYCRRSLGIWTEVSWRDHALEVRRAVSALRAFGVEPGDRILLLGDSRPEFVAVLLAAQLLRAGCACAYPATAPDGVAALVGTLAPTVCIGETADDAALMASAQATLGREGDQPAPPDGTESRTPTVLVLDSRSQRCGFPSWRERLESTEPVDEPEMAALASALREQDTAYVTVSAGTSGAPRAYPVDHATAGMIWSGLLERLPRISARDRVLADVPAAHPAGLAAAAVLPMLTGCRPFFVDDPRQSHLAAGEIQPTVLIATARYWTALASAVRAEVMDAQWVPRKLLEALGALDRARDASRASRGRALRTIAAGSVGIPLRRRLGLSRVRVALAVGGSLPPVTTAFWRSLGVLVDEVFVRSDAGGPTALRHSTAHGSAYVSLLDGSAVAPPAESTASLRAVEGVVETSTYVTRCVAVDAGAGLCGFVVARSRVVEGGLRRRNRPTSDAVSAAAFFTTSVLEEVNAELSAAGLPELASIRLLDSDFTPPELTPIGGPTDALREQLSARAGESEARR
jgi:hypothetical protein